MNARRFTLIVVLAALVAVVAVVVSSGGIDLGGGEDEVAEGEPAAAEEPKPELPANPDDLRGTDSRALTRTRNLRRALAVLDRERRKVEGEFDGLRVAPGRIDTIIVHPDDRRTNIQLRPDLEIAFSSTSDFPTPPDFREDGLSARDVDAAAPARLLRQIDGVRRGSAARDVDYLVIRRDIIDGHVDVSAYMRVRTPRPRAFLKEPGEELRAIG